MALVARVRIVGPLSHRDESILFIEGLKFSFVHVRSSVGHTFVHVGFLSAFERNRLMELLIFPMLLNPLKMRQRPLLTVWG